MVVVRPFCTNDSPSAGKFGRQVGAHGERY
jgi:hypothetical protein